MAQPRCTAPDTADHTAWIVCENAFHAVNRTPAIVVRIGVRTRPKIAVHAVEIAPVIAVHTADTPVPNARIASSDSFNAPVIFDPSAWNAFTTPPIAVSARPLSRPNTAPMAFTAGVITAPAIRPRVPPNSMKPETRPRSSPDMTAPRPPKIVPVAEMNPRNTPSTRPMSPAWRNPQIACTAPSTTCPSPDHMRDQSPDNRPANAWNTPDTTRTRPWKMSTTPLTNPTITPLSSVVRNRPTGELMIVAANSANAFPADSSTPPMSRNAGHKVPDTVPAISRNFGPSTPPTDRASSTNHCPTGDPTIAANAARSWSKPDRSDPTAPSPERSWSNIATTPRPSPDMTSNACDMAGSSAVPMTALKFSHDATIRACFPARVSDSRANAPCASADWRVMIAIRAIAFACCSAAPLSLSCPRAANSAFTAVSFREMPYRSIGSDSPRIADANASTASFVDPPYWAARSAPIPIRSCVDFA